MDNSIAIREKVAKVLGSILDEDDLKLEDATVADAVDGWDSINHVKLIIALEKFYKIRFAPEEITAPENVGALVTLIKSHIDAKGT